MLAEKGPLPNSQHRARSCRTKPKLCVHRNPTIHKIWVIWSNRWMINNVVFREVSIRGRNTRLSGTQSDLRSRDDYSFVVQSFRKSSAILNDNRLGQKKKKRFLVNNCYLLNGGSARGCTGDFSKASTSVYIPAATEKAAVTIHNS